MNYFHIIRKRLITLGVKPKDSRQISVWFQNQVVNRGVLGALNYFKNVGDTLVGYISKSGYKAQWVATTQGGFPKSLIVLKGYPLEVQLRVAKIARAILLDTPTPAMVLKLSVAATSPYDGEEGAMERLGTLIKSGLSSQSFQQRTFHDSIVPALKSARTYTNRSVPTGTEVGLDLEKLFSTFRSWGGLITDLPDWPSLMYPLHPSYVGRTLMNYGEHPHVGELGGVMEQGGKLRIFAAPSVLLNNSLEPLQKYLDAYRAQCLWDCFKDQSKGAIWVREKMNEGLLIHSIDLSSATCRFPFEVQLDLCKDLSVPSCYTTLYEKVARGTYKVQSHLVPLFGEYVTWTVGQPLGLNPSMSSFALCHGLLLVGLCVELGINTQDSFRILGDDVVTCNTSLANAYRQVISSLGISISEHKSYDSKLYAEFAGYSITPDLMVRPGRWKRPTRLNILGLFSDLGADVTKEVEFDTLAVRLLAFRNGDFTPDSDSWLYWLKLNSLCFPGVGEKYRKFNRSTDWFTGATRFLQKELRTHQPYFDSERAEHFYEVIPESIVKDQVSSLVWNGLEYHTSESIMILLESFASDLLPFDEYETYIRQINELYEAYTWSKPLTSGRKSRDELANVELLLTAIPA